MSRLQDTVRRVKNLFKINNVYDCARPLLLVLGLVGVGATNVRNTEDVYTLHNTSHSKLMTLCMSVTSSALMIALAVNLFRTLAFKNFVLSVKIMYFIGFFSLFLNLFTVGVGYTVTYVCCKRLERLLQIIQNVDRQLAEVNIRVKHWQITLKVAVVALVSFDYKYLLFYLRKFIQTWNCLFLPQFSITILFNFIFLWVILFVCIIHERFVCLTKVLEQNATVTNIHIVGGRSRRDNYVLRRVRLARHVHEQLLEAVQLFSDSCRYVVLGLLTGSMISILLNSFVLLVYHKVRLLRNIFSISLQIVVLTSICQANKNERRVRTARIRHLLAFETNREIVQQLQQYIMYNAHSTPGLIDLQFTSVDNVLLFTIIDVVISNVLIIYSYTRQWD